MSQAIDQRIKQARKKGISVTLISGAITATIFIGFLVWLFFVKGFNLIIGPSDALAAAHVEVVDGLAWANESNIYTLEIGRAHV